MSTEQRVTSTRLNLWRGVALAGILFFIVMMFNGWIAPWKNKVLFDCPPIGDGGYVQLDPTVHHEGCEYFGPPVSDR